MSFDKWKIDCYTCEFRSKKFCNNYLKLLKECKEECQNDNDYEYIMYITKDRKWLTVDELNELKRVKEIHSD